MLVEDHKMEMLLSGGRREELSTCWAWFGARKQFVGGER